MKNAWENALREFRRNIDDVRQIGKIYQSFIDKAPLSEGNLTDLLRAQLVNTLSAFDRLMHEYVRIGIEKQLLDEAPPTRKTKTFTLDIESYLQLNKLDSSPNGISQKYQILSSRVESVLRTLTFQSPDKIKDALSYIWEEPHKWQVLSGIMNLDEKNLTQKIKLYVERRNQIVHEADYDCTKHKRRILSIQTVEECIKLYKNLAEAIHSQLINSIILRSGKYLIQP